jgi:nucleotide-binding universal stress UspA family protein
MTASKNRPVVVGVDGSRANQGALRYAVEEARRLDAPLEVVHVVPDHLIASPLVVLAMNDPAALGTRIVRDAEDDVADLFPEVDTVGWVHHGSRPVRLAEAAARGLSLVVGRDDRPLVERLLRGDTATGVAARAAVPVVVVPADWTPQAATHDVVLVGLKSPDDVQPLLDDAFCLAEEVGATLAVLHSWWVPSEYADMIESRVAVEEWRHRSTVEIETALRTSRARYPDVKVDIRVIHGYPGPSLVEASAGADVVVIGRRAHGVPAAVHLGGTARAVLRAASCPVRIVPPDRAERAV